MFAKNSSWKTKLLRNVTQGLGIGRIFLERLRQRKIVWNVQPVIVGVSDFRFTENGSKLIIQV
jgi:hypothetical protein